MIPRAILRTGASCLISGALLVPTPLLAEVSGVAPGIPSPEHHNVIVQLFNWSFDDIKDNMEELRAHGYSHIHVSPPQESNEHVWQWWGRYQPVDYSIIKGPLGNEAAFQQMSNQVAVALSNANAYARSQKVAQNKALANEIVAELQQQTEVESILQVTARELGKALGAKRARIRLSADTDITRK